jgi:iron complex outermembrane receptor protein/vitamin B12 transporter
MLLAPLGWDASSAPADIPRLEPVVVTGTALPRPLEATLASVTVLPAADLERLRLTILTEALRQVPGLHVDQTGARGGLSSVYIRGGDPNFTPVMVDGIPLNDPLNPRGGSVDLSLLDLIDAERIEIVRGPLSSRYGSDALSGAINLITQPETGARGLQVSAEGGRFGYVRAAGRGHGPLTPDLSYTLAAALTRNDAQVEGDRYRLATLAGSTVWSPDEAQSVRLLVRYWDRQSHAFPEGSGGPRFARFRGAEARASQGLLAGLRWQQAVSDRWSSTLVGDVYRATEDLDSPGVAGRIPPNTRATEFLRARLQWQQAFTPWDALQLAAGLEGVWEDGEVDGALDQTVPLTFAQTRARGGVFVEALWTPAAAWRFSAAVRVDVPERFGAEVSPRVGLGYTVPAAGTQLRAAWGQGFKLPSLFALADPLVGNPALRPEHSTGAEVGVSQPLWGRTLEVSATAFWNRFDDLIDFSAEAFRLVNRSRVRTQGLEVGLTWAPWRTGHVDATLTYLDTDIRGSPEPLRNRPRWAGGLGVSWQSEALGVGARATWVGRRPDTDFLIPPSGRTAADGFVKVDAAVSLRLSRQVRAFLAVDNLFGQAYEETLGFPAPGILPRAGLEGRF